MTVSKPPAALDGVLPGQLGIIMLGRVIMGDIAVTMVDLALRQAIRVEEDPAGGWLVSGRKSPGSATLADYEKALVDALPDAPSPLDRVEAPELEKVRSALVHDGISRGWLRHLHHDQRTPRAEDLAQHVHAFQRVLRKQRQEQGEAALTGRLLPYALHFALVSDDAAPLARFAHAWVNAFGELPGWRPPKPPKPDFDYAEPAPVEHSAYGFVHAGRWLCHPRCSGDERDRRPHAPVMGPAAACTSRIKKPVAITQPAVLTCGT